MAQTQRSYAELIALLADNTSGDISAEDVRDLLESLRQPHCGIYISAQVETVISGANVWTKALGTTLASAPDSHLFTLVGNNRLRYDGPSDRHVQIDCNASMIAVGNNVVLDLAIAHNDTILNGYVSRKISTGSDVGAVSIAADVNMSTNDYIEIWVRNQTSSDNLTLTTGYMRAFGIID